MIARSRRERRVAVRLLGLVTAVLLLGACGGEVVLVGTVDESAIPADPAASTEPTERAEPTEQAEPEVRPMDVGDCLEKVGLDELGKPIPEYVDCAEPHMFEVTGLFTLRSPGAEFDADRLGAEVKATCRGSYESYTGRDPRDIGNAFGWDAPSEAAWAAGDHAYACYATAPAFEDLVGSVALVPR